MWTKNFNLCPQPPTLIALTMPMNASPVFIEYEAFTVISHGKLFHFLCLSILVYLLQKFYFSKLLSTELYHNVAETRGFKIQWRAIHNSEIYFHNMFAIENCLKLIMPEK